MEITESRVFLRIRRIKLKAYVTVTFDVPCSRNIKVIEHKWAIYAMPSEDKTTLSQVRFKKDCVLNIAINAQQLPTTPLPGRKPAPRWNIRYRPSITQSFRNICKESLRSIRAGKNQRSWYNPLEFLGCRQW